MARHPNAPAYFHHSMPARDPSDRAANPTNAARGIMIGLACVPLILLAAFGAANLAVHATRSVVLRVNASYQETSVPDHAVRSVAMAAREGR